MLLLLQLSWNHNDVDKLAGSLTSLEVPDSSKNDLAF